MTFALSLAVNQPLVLESTLASAVPATLVADYLRGGGPPVKQNPFMRLLRRQPQKATAREKLGRLWYRLPQFGRYCVSGIVGNLLFYVIEQALYEAMERLKLDNSVRAYQDSISFAVGYLMHIVGQHYAHALLVYGLATIDTSSKYRRTLFGLYGVLIPSTIASTWVNGQLLQFGLKKTAAFMVTISLFTCINYTLVSAIVRRSNLRATKEHSSRRHRERRRG
jgi:hypothetical protein